MVERGDYVVPHLLGSEILTKPPLFFWLVATSMKAFGSTAEWAARFPSFVIAILFVATQFLFARVSGLSREKATLSAFVLVTGGAFLQLASAAEIDLFFGFLCALGAGFSFLANMKRTIGYAILMGLVTGLGLLTKGPIIFIFVFIPHLLFAGFLWKRRAEASSLQTTIMHLLVSGVVAVTVAAPWFVLLGERVSWERIVEVQRVELVGRFFGPDRQSHGVLFYIPTAVVSFLPWSIFPLFELFRALKQTRGILELVREFFRHPDSFFYVHHLFIFIFGVVFLSAAEGKASRYLFPLYSSGAYLCAACAAHELARLKTKFSEKKILLALIGLIVLFRLTEIGVFVPYRNATRGVKAAVQEIQNVVPAEAPIYTVEYFERWVNYYLKRSDRNSFRISPAVAAQQSQDPSEKFLLLNEEHETWRIAELQSCDPETRIVRKIDSLRIPAMIVATTGQAFRCLTVTREMPTNYVR